MNCRTCRVALNPVEAVLGGDVCQPCVEDFKALERSDATIAHAEETLRTVKRATLFDGVIDTYRTETELNGWRPTQGRMAL